MLASGRDAPTLQSHLESLVLRCALPAIAGARGPVAVVDAHNRHPSLALLSPG
jgi:hypothetical protein